MIASRIAALCRGSPLSTPTLVSPAAPDGGRPGGRGGRVVGPHAPGAACLRLPRHRGVDLRPVGAGDDQPGARAVAGRVRAAPATRSGRCAASSSSAGVTEGETSTTSAPAASSRGTRRAATAPPPTTSTCRPRSRRPSRYASPCPSAGSARGAACGPVTAAGYPLLRPDLSPAWPAGLARRAWPAGAVSGPAWRRGSSGTHSPPSGRGRSNGTQGKRGNYPSFVTFLFESSLCTAAMSSLPDDDAITLAAPGRRGGGRPGNDTGRFAAGQRDRDMRGQSA